jgi:hypothetical protein
MQPNISRGICKFGVRYWLLSGTTALFLLTSIIAQAAPTVVFPPANQLVEVGTNVTFSVFVVPSSPPVLPSTSSGTLQLWLKADEGVITNASGRVSQWEDQSGQGNDASQLATNNQPLLVNPTGIGGRTALRFNGVQDGVNENYLHGPENVGLTNAMTAFAVYNAFNTATPFSSVWFAGVPGSYGAGRGYTIYYQDMDFTTWTYDYVTPWAVPTNTYRICTDRVNSSLTTAEIFDNSASGNTNFSESMSSAKPPAAGYYVGGIDPVYGWGGYTLNGDVAELVCYNGYLTDADRLAVASYLEEKYYFAPSTAGFGFQWQFNGTNISGATNATLTLASVQTNEAGSYSVIVSDLSGSTTVSNTVLSVWAPPSVTVSPQILHVSRGSNANFSATALGTGPFTYQWSFNGGSIAVSTNSVLSLANVQSTNVGNYSVTVTSPYGHAVSSDAILIVDELPSISRQPQSQNIVVGNSVALSVTVAPLVTSGTLQLWLKADAGVVTNSSGQVTVWRDQSGNTNDATQTDSNRLPTLVYPSAIGGSAALRFNGIQDGVHGTYLQGLGNVAAPNAMTVFAVYNEISAAPYSSVWYVGVPGNTGASRGYTIYNEHLDFTTWDDDYNTPFIVPTNTYRICTDRVTTNLGMVELFDTSANSETNFSEAMAPTSTPAAGYFIGGLNPVYGDGGYNLAGDIAELIYYSGYLTESDRLAVLGYLEQKYFQANATAADAYQWEFDGTNIADATNATLVLTNLQAAQSGTYTVTVTDTAGSITSSNALLEIGSAPGISLQPQSQIAAGGADVTFTTTATGTGPLNFGWFFNGVTVPGATNSSLNLTNVGSVNAGSYTVTVSSPFGTAVSSNAVLTVDLLPVIGNQPQNQSIVVGSNVTFSVPAGSALPSVSSGALQLWLKADTGVVTNASGQVSQWKDQSGSSNDAFQSITNYQPSLVYPPSIGGNASIRFNASQASINYLRGSGDVGVPDAMTTFTVVDTFTATNYVPMAWLIGNPPNFGAVRSETDYQGLRTFSTWGYGYDSPFEVPLNTYRIWGDRMDSNLTTLELFDTSATGSTNFTAPMPSATVPGAGYYVGGIDPSLQQVAGWKLNGDIAEWLVYQGRLSDADRLAVLGYLQQKYFQAGSTAGDSYQWEFDGTNIAGATNSTLTLTNVQGTDAGTYTVTVTDVAGSTISSNAVLTTLFPAAITSSPTNQSVVAGTTVMFTASATGTAPLSFQWQFDGTNIAGETNTYLTVNNAVVANAGSYTMVASNPYGTATSSPATLSVDESTVQVVSTSATGGGTVVVSIDLTALGTESGVGFTLNFDPTVLTYVGATAGSGAAGTGLNVNPKYASLGQLVCVVAQPVGTFAIGTNDLFDITFQIAVVTNAVTTSVTFGNQFTPEQVSDPSPQVLPAVFMPGVVIISPTELEGDVSPRFTGDEVLSVTDWIQEGRFVAGLDTITDPSEFQRADCAPRSTLGDGQLTVADWAQVGRYVSDADQPTAAGGPSTPQPQVRKAIHPIKDGGTPALTLIPLTQGSQTTSVSVQLSSQGEVNSLGFSVSFNRAIIQFVNASLGAGISNAMYIPNTGPATNGSVGFLVGLLSGTFPAGSTPLVNLTFASVGYSNTTSLVFSGAVTACDMVDTNTAEVSANFVNAVLNVGGSPWPALSIVPSGDSIALSWPSSATGLRLQSASTLDGTWSDVSATPAINGDSMVFTTSAPTNTIYYRLKY